MKETILLYNLDSAAIRNKIKFLCIQGGIHIRVVEKNQYDVPIGTLAFGKKEDMELYLRSENSEEKPSFNDPMLVFAGFTGQKLDQFLNAMRKQKIPKINLKAMLTEHNVKWDSMTLHDELAREHEAMNKKQEFAGVSKQTKSENQIIYICDFRRYEKSAFSNILFQSRSSQTTNIDDLILGLLFSGCLGKFMERFVEEVRRDRSNSSQSFKKQLQRKL